MERKGQAAMEFLMTYGWAILAAVIAIGVLAYFGVFSPGKYAPSATVLNPPFQAVGSVVQAGQIQLEIKNGLGEDVTITNVTISGCGTDDTEIALTTSANEIATVTCSPELTGDNFKGDITLRYTKSGSSLVLTSTGTIAEKITA